MITIDQGIIQRQNSDYLRHDNVDICWEARPNERAHHKFDKNSARLQHPQKIRPKAYSQDEIEQTANGWTHIKVSVAGSMRSNIPVTGHTRDERTSRYIFGERIWPCFQ